MIRRSFRKLDRGKLKAELGRLRAASAALMPFVVPIIGCPSGLGEDEGELCGAAYLRRVKGEGERIRREAGEDAAAFHARLIRLASRAGASHVAVGVGPSRRAELRALRSDVGPDGTLHIGGGPQPEPPIEPP